MRFVPVKTETQQAVLMQHRTRDFLVRRLTQIANALRARLAEFGVVVPKGIHNLERLLTATDAADLPPATRPPLDLLAARFRDTKGRIDTLTAGIRAAAETDEVARRLQTLVTGSGLARMKCSGGAFQPEQGPEGPASGRLPPARSPRRYRTYQPSGLPAICRPGSG